MGNVCDHTEMQACANTLIATFYCFVPLHDLHAWQSRLQTDCASAGLHGTILLAHEGINATLCGATDSLRDFLQTLCREPGFGSMRVQESLSSVRPLRRLKVRIKPEIVTLGAGPVTVRGATGGHVSPEHWHQLLDRPEVVLIDARNRYETAIGRFVGAIDPQTDHFSELPGWLLGDARLRDRPPVAMYCTGGIRCEKSTAWLRAQGFDEVYQLDGGILNYLASVPREASRWQGECFVFDERVSVNHELRPGGFGLCPSCGYPVKADRAPESSCPGCGSIERHDLLGQRT